MRTWRASLFADPFFKKDRSIKSLNKVLAAKRRKRDGTGKFNIEAKNSTTVTTVKKVTREIVFTARDDASIEKLPPPSCEQGDQEPEPWICDDFRMPERRHSLSNPLPLFIQTEKFSIEDGSLDCETLPYMLFGSPHRNLLEQQ